MRTLRTALTAAALILLCAGYGASQVSYFLDTYADYAARVDSPPVQNLALLLLLSAVILALIRDRDSMDRIPAKTDRTSPNPANQTDPPPAPSVDSRFTIHDSRSLINRLLFTLTIYGRASGR